MFKAGSSRFVLLLAVILTLSLGGTLISNTYATGIDKRVAYDGEGQQLNSGLDYNVAIKYHDGNQYLSMLDRNASVISDDMYWSPGRTEILYVKLANGEAFPVNCTLTMDVQDVDGYQSFEDTLSYAVIFDDLKAAGAHHPRSWTEFNTAAGLKGKLTKDDHVLLTQKELLSQNNPQENETAFAVAIHMNETATSKHQNAKMELRFKLQIDAEHEPGTTAADLAAGAN